MNEANIVIMAAGASTRMRGSYPESRTVDGPKSMIPVGPEGRPLLDYILLNAVRAGYRDCVIVVAAAETVIRSRYSGTGKAGLPGHLEVSFAEQGVHEGRVKPAGTADALLCALKARPDWAGTRFTVCNSDNLYSANAMRVILESKHENSMIAYDRLALGLPAGKISSFALVGTDSDGCVLDIVEKPGAGLAAEDTAGGISMNIFRFSYDVISPVLELVPFDRVRGEKELTAAVKMLIESRPGSLKAVPLSEPVPDLTAWRDIAEMDRFISRNYPSFEA